MNSQKYDRNAQKWITEDAVRKNDGWDYFDEERIESDFIEALKSPAVKFVLTALALFAGFAALFVVLCQ